MRLALRELRRRPGRFVVAVAALSLITVLLLIIGALTDGLYRGSTGAIRAQRADVFTYSSDARDSFLRSRITPETRAEIEAVPGVARTGGLGVALLGAEVPGKSELADVAVFGYQLPPSGVPAPPPAGQAWADRRLETAGVKVGQTLRVGPSRVPVRVAGLVSDTSYLLQGGLWVAPTTWRQIQNASRPDAAVAPGVFQVLLVQGDPGVAPADLATRIDRSTGGATSSLTKPEAVLSLPGTKQQNSTFNAVIGITFVVAGLVVALFFALLTLERLPLYGVLKAIGASTGQLASGLVTQAVVVAAAAFLAGTAVTFVLAQALPAGVPAEFLPGRAATVAVGLVLTSLIGGAVSLRRIIRVDPASAIGGGS